MPAFKPDYKHRRHHPPHDLRAEQLAIGAMVYIADYTPVLNTKFCQRLVCTMQPRMLDDYWLIYVASQGLTEVDPIPITDEIIAMLPDINDDLHINGTQFTLDHTPKQGIYTISAAGTQIFPLHYIHQLQLAYSLLLGADLDIAALQRSLKPYRSTTRDTDYHTY